MMLRLLAWFCLLALPAAALALPKLELDVSLEPAQRRLQASATLPSSGTAFSFSLHPSLTVHAASLDGRNLAVHADGESDGLRRWRVQTGGMEGRLRINYSGQLPALEPGLDHRRVLAAMPPMASPGGSFLPSSGGWYPDPGTAFAYRINLSLPAAQRGLVAGTLQSEDIPATETGRYRASYDFPYPSAGIDLMAGPYRVREKLHGLPGGIRVRLRTWFLPELDAVPGLADSYLEDSARYLTRYSELIGTYPYREFSVVASPLPTGFGMPTLTYMGAEVLKLPFIRATSLGHEVLHNWWGNGVRVDASEGNWAEGLTTFMADYAYKEQASPEAARDMRLSWLRDAAAVPAAERRPLSSFRSRQHGAQAALGYGKAAMLFVMLRDDIGEQAFGRGIRLFWERQRLRQAGWSELQAAFEQAAGRKLDTFFAQWLRRTEAPSPRIVAARHAAAGIALTLEQDGPAYALRIPIALQRGGKTETHVARLDERRRTVTLEVPAESVQLDPELRVWRSLDAGQLPPIWREWIIASSPRLTLLSAETRMRAAAQVLASRLFENPPTPVGLEGAAEGDAPLLLVGSHKEVDAALARAGLPPRPVQVGTRGSAQAWTLRTPAGKAVGVISAMDAAALSAIAGPLPHYGAQSWLVFEGRRAIARGVWPLQSVTVPVAP